MLGYARPHAAIAEQDRQRIDTNRTQHEEHHHQNENTGNAAAANDLKAGTAKAPAATEAATYATALRPALIFHIVTLPTALPAH